MSEYFELAKEITKEVNAHYSSTALVAEIQRLRKVLEETAQAASDAVSLLRVSLDVTGATEEGSPTMYRVVARVERQIKEAREMIR